MESEKELAQPVEQKDEQGNYEAPRIESSLTPAALAREVQYAGATDNTVPIG